MRKNSKQISSGQRNFSQNSYEQSFGVNPEQYHFYTIHLTKLNLLYQ